MSQGSITLIVGGGFGGIATARQLRTALPDRHRIVLVSKSRTFQIGTAKTWVMLGQIDPQAVTRPLDILNRHGIETIFAEVQRIDPAHRTISTAAGNLSADYIVIALGAELDMGLVPGMADSAETFYTREGAVHLKETLQRFDGGQIVLLIPRIPFQCPPGPYEAAMMLYSHLEAGALSRPTKIDIYTVEKAPMATAGPQIGKYIVERLQERGIGFHPQTQTQNIDATSKAVILADGARIPYDLLLAIPPHTATRAVRDSGLVNAAGWIPVNPQTMELENSPSPQRVYAIGDTASVPLPGRFVPEMPLVLPKAGVFAERQGAVAAARIAGHILNRETKDVYDGAGFCYIEVGGGKALRGDGSFFDMPHPTMTPREPDTAQFDEKKAWVNSWMARYL